jgi:aryl-alcohol dehydrogenase-like predicted oxidoreductase
MHQLRQRRGEEDRERAERPRQLDPVLQFDRQDTRAPVRDEQRDDERVVWVLRDPRVTSAVIGASSVEQLEANVTALEQLDLSPDELAEIDRWATESEVNLWARQSEA